MTLPIPGRTTALVLSGGVALGAYEAGAYAALEDGGIHLDQLAGASVGAINAVLIAGNPPGQRVARLREFWAGLANDPIPGLAFWGSRLLHGRLREGYNVAGIMQTMLLGRPGMFRPRLLPHSDGRPGLYDLSPLQSRLEQLVDFRRVNNGEVRLSIAATDVVSGDRVVFEAGRGAGIGPEQVLASCAQMPVCAPIEIDGRLLVDGCYSGDTPIDLVLDAPGQEQELLCFVVDLFAPRGRRPSTLGAAANRAMDLTFGNQTRARLDAAVREGVLRAALIALARQISSDDPALPLLQNALPAGEAGKAAATAVLLLGYHGRLDEAGPAKGFDYTAATLLDRWEGGAAHARAALQAMAAWPNGAWPAGVTVQEVEPDQLS